MKETLKILLAVLYGVGAYIAINITIYGSP